MKDWIIKNKLWIIISAVCICVIVGIILLVSFNAGKNDDENDENITTPAIETTEPVETTTTESVTTISETTAKEQTTVIISETEPEITTAEITTAEITEAEITEATTTYTTTNTQAPIVTTAIVTTTTQTPVVTTSKPEETNKYDGEDGLTLLFIDYYYHDGHSYNTDWGMRPLEFDDISRNCKINFNGKTMYMHYDRYGNTWIDEVSGKSSAEDKNLYSRGSGYNAIAYFTQGRYVYKGGRFEVFTKDNKDYYCHIEDEYNDKYIVIEAFDSITNEDGTLTKVEPQWIYLPHDMPVLDCDITFNEGYYTIDFSRVLSLPESPYVGKSVKPIIKRDYIDLYLENEP